MNASDEAEVKKAIQKGKSQKERETNDLLSILESRQGRRFIYRQLKLCGVFEISYTGDQHTVFREGEKNVGLRLFKEIEEANPDAYFLMIKESREDNYV